MKNEKYTVGRLPLAFSPPDIASINTLSGGKRPMAKSKSQILIQKNALLQNYRTVDIKNNRMKNILTVVLFLIVNTGFSQSNSFFIHPNQTDINYVAAQDSHMVVRNSTGNINKLFLFIGGSGTEPASYFRIVKFAGDLGYDVVNISYPNSVAAASLKNSSDELAFDHYRQEICFGTPLSSFVTVDTLNSILTRTIKLLNYLNTTYPSQNWNQYLINSNKLDWSKIVVGGHSQGSGHASYFAKFEIPERVLLFSGPNDYSDHFAQPANWLGASGVTPINRHFAYLSLLDEVVDFSKQLSNLDDLGLYPIYDTIHADISAPPYNNSHCLYTTQNPGFAILYHNTTIKLSNINDLVWEYMLTSDIVTAVAETKKKKAISIYPNPTHSVLSVYSNENLFNKDYIVQNVNGQTMLSGRLINSDLDKIDLSTLENGTYFLLIDRQIFQIIKQD